MSDVTGDLKILAKGRHLHFVQRNRWEFIHRPNVTGIVAIIAVTDDGKMIFVQQYREPVQSDVIENPAGLVGDEVDMPDEALADAARRELHEETGYEATTLEFLTAGPPSAGLGSEVVTFFLATGLKRTGEGGGVEGENIHVHEVPIANAHAWLEDRLNAGIMIDPKIYLGLYFAQRYWNSKG